MGFFNKYPYTDFHELNLDWVLQTIKLIGDKVDNFINFNSIKYADPIAWNITTQYAANTVVIDSNTGIAYLSTQAIPAGVSLSDLNYWTKIFDLSEIISKTLRSYDTAIDLINDADIKIGMTAHTAGFYNPDDDGNAFYFITDTAPSTPYISLNNGLFAILLYGNEINVKQLGAYGDGVTDDTSIFQSIIDADIDMFIPAGEYVINGLTITNTNSMLGVADQSKLLLKNTIDIQDVFYKPIKDLAFTAIANINGPLIRLYRSNHVVIERCIFGQRGFNVNSGILIYSDNSGYYNSIYDCFFSTLPLAIDMYNSNSCSVLNTVIYDCIKGIKLDSVNGTRIQNTTFQNFHDTAVEFRYTIGQSMTYANMVESCYFEFADDNALIAVFDFGNDSNVKGNYIIGNKINTPTNTDKIFFDQAAENTIINGGSGSLWNPDKFFAFVRTAMPAPNWMKSYTGTQFNGTLALFEDPNDNTISDLYIHEKNDAGTAGWHKVPSENSSGVVNIENGQFNKICAVPTDTASVWENNISYKTTSRNLEFYRSGLGGWIVLQKVSAGSTANRPSSFAAYGECYFDTSLGKPIWHLSGSNWVDATGATV